MDEKNAPAPARVRITDAREAHLPQLVRLEERCFSEPWTGETLRVQFSDRFHTFLVAEGPGGEVLGYAAMTHVLDEGSVSNLAVAPEARRRGIGQELLKALLARSAALGLAFVTLEVRESNAPARALYEKYGFAASGRRKNYYDRPKEDALLMIKIWK